MAKSDETILKEARDRFKIAYDLDYEQRLLALDDLEFFDGKQWPDKIKAERQSDDRPCLVINKMPSFVDQVAGDIRQNEPSIKVIPEDSKASKPVARILSGWIKHVQVISDADIAYDHAGEHSTICGYGALRVITDYIDDNSFDQEAYIKKVDNALAVYWGPHTEYDCSDAPYCFIIEDIQREEYKDTYGEEPMPFNDADSQFVDGWCTDKTVRIAEYFVKEPEEKTIYLLENGDIVNTLPKGQKAARKRKVKTYKIKWYKVSGNKVLDKKEWPGKKYIPVVPVWGKELNVAGKKKVRGLIRHAKDPQRMYNYWQSCDTEQVALAPKTPYLATPKQLQNHEKSWKEAHKKNYPFLYVNPDEKAPGWPKREPPPQASSAMVEKIGMADQEMRDTAGLQKANLGMQSNERSGVAIRERKHEGDTGTFAYPDNLARSVRQVGRILVDIAPAILDTERIIRIIEGDKELFEAINVETEAGDILNNLAEGRYGVQVSIGPSFATQRTEARESMGEFIQYVPQAAPLIGDIYAEVNDWPGAERVSKRLRYMVPPEIRAEEDAEKAREEGKPLPQQQTQQPNPMEEIEIQTAAAKLAQEQVRIEQEKTKLVLLNAEIDLKKAQAKDIVKKHVEEIMNEGAVQ